MVLERETGFEPATISLATRDSTTELLPHDSKQIYYFLLFSAMKNLFQFMKTCIDKSVVNIYFIYIIGIYFLISIFVCLFMLLDYDVIVMWNYK